MYLKSLNFVGDKVLKIWNPVKADSPVPNLGACLLLTTIDAI